MVSIEYEKNTLEYQETMNLEIGKIVNKKNWRPIYEVIDNSVFAVTNVFLTEILDQCKNSSNETLNLTSEVKVSLKIKRLWSKGNIHKWS